MEEKYFIPDKFNINQKYHLVWAYKRCVWKLKSFDNSGNCILVTKDGKELKAKTKDLRLITNDAYDRYNQIKREYTHGKK